MTYNVPSEESEPVQTCHINATPEEILARYRITELCKGWLVCRDASERGNYRSLFTKEGAYVWTNFIQVSIKDRANGDFIMHRENGTLANVNLAKQQGIGKTKATITQLLLLKGIPVDVECDCRLIFFVKIEDGEWKTQFVKLFYEKDKMIPVLGHTVPVIPQEELDGYTEGYKYLSAAQHSLGHPILNDLPNANNQGWYDMYKAMADWSQGKEINLFWEYYEK